MSDLIVLCMRHTPPITTDTIFSDDGTPKFHCPECNHYILPNDIDVVLMDGDTVIPVAKEL